MIVRHLRHLPVSASWLGCLLLCAGVTHAPHIHAAPAMHVAQSMHVFKGDFAQISVDGHAAYLHRSGKITVDKVGSTSGPLTTAVKHGAWGAINAAGKVVIPFRYAAIEAGDIDDPDSNSAADDITRFYKVKLHGKYGIIAPDGTVISKPAYQDVKPIDDTIAGVEKDGRWGWISLADGKLLQAPTYGKIYNHDSKLKLLVVVKNDKYGAVTYAGRVLVPTRHDWLHLYYIGDTVYLHATDNDKSGLLSADGKVVLPTKYRRLRAESAPDVLSFQSDDKTGLVTLSGKVIVPPTHDLIRDTKDTNLFEVTDKQPGKGTRPHYLSGIVDRTGKLIVPIRYDRIKVLNARGEKVFNAQDADYPNALRGRWFLVTDDDGQTILDRHGQPVLPSSYDKVEPLYQAGHLYFIVSASGKHYSVPSGAFAADGEPLLPVKYQDIEGFAGTLLKVTTNDDGVGLYDTQTHKMLVKPVNKAVSRLGDKLIQITRRNPDSDFSFDDLHRVIDFDGSIVHDFAKAEYHTVGIPGLLVREANDQPTQLLDRDGKVLFEDADWDYGPRDASTFLILDDGPGDSRTGFRDGLLKIHRERYRIGSPHAPDNMFVDATGKVVQFDQYDYVGDFWHGHALAAVTGKQGHALYGIIDRQGQPIIPVKYRTFEWLEHTFKAHGLLKACAHDQCGVYKADGKQILPLAYDDVAFVNDEQLIRITRDGHIGIADLDGNVIVKPVYSRLHANRGYDDAYWPVLLKQGPWHYYINAHGQRLDWKSQTYSY